MVVLQNLPMAAHSHADLKSSESCQIGDTDNHANFADNDTLSVEEQNVSTSENLKEKEDTVSLMLQVYESYQNCILLSSQSILLYMPVFGKCYSVTRIYEINILDLCLFQQTMLSLCLPWETFTRIFFRYISQNKGV